MQAVCGGCAMVINGVPALACATFADEVSVDTLRLEPLSKFPVIADLIVDRSVIYEILFHANAYLENATHCHFPRDQLSHYCFLPRLLS